MTKQQSTKNDGCIPREIAWQTVCALADSEFNGHLKDALHDACEKHQISSKDRSFAYLLATECIRNKTLLEHELVKAAKRPLEKIEPRLRILIMLAFAELLFLYRSKDHATVYHTVEICKRARRKSWVGFVNGILRQWLRDKRDVNTGDDVQDDLQTLYSHPQWFIDLLRENWAIENVIEILKWNNSSPKQYARLRIPLAEIHKEIDEEVLQPAQQFGDDVVEILSMQKLLFSNVFASGTVYIQQPWSIDVTRHLPVNGGDRVLDMCAAPGGKSIGIADKADVTIIAADSNPRRIPSIYDNIARCSMHQIFPIVMDGRMAPCVFGAASFDAIILDAPCSSLGVIQRHPSVRWRVTPELCNYLSSLQQELLDAAIACVKPGGHILYSVCTFLPDETVRNKEYAEKTGDVICIEEQLRLPGDNGYDGGYYVLLQRKTFT